MKFFIFSLLIILIGCKKNIEYKTVMPKLSYDISSITQSPTLPVCNIKKDESERPQSVKSGYYLYLGSSSDSKYDCDSACATIAKQRCVTLQNVNKLCYNASSCASAFDKCTASYKDECTLTCSSITSITSNSVYIHSGILVNECQFAKENIYNTTVLKNCKQELSLFSTLKKQEFELFTNIEKNYIDKINYYKQRNFMEKYGVYVGALVGILTSSLILYIGSTLK